MAEEYENDLTFLDNDVEELDVKEVTEEEITSAYVDSAFRMYMREVFKIPVLTADENKQLIKLVRAGDMNAREKMIQGNLRLVINMAYKYVNRLNHMQLLDIIQEGNFGLMRAIEDYDPEVSAFSTYAYNWIKQAITRSISDKENEIRKPVHIQSLSYKYLKLLENNKDISDKDICKELDITMDTLSNIRQALSTSTFSMNQTIDDDEKSELGDFIAAPNSSYNEVEDEMASYTLFIALREVLSDYEYYIVYSRILNSKRKTLEEIALEFGVTRERIRQIENKVLRKIKPFMQNNKKMQIVLNKIYEREGKIFNLRTRPISPLKIIEYLYVKDSLNAMQKRLFHMIYFNKYNMSKKDIANKLGLGEQAFEVLYRDTLGVVEKKLSNRTKFESYRFSMIKNYGSRIYDLDISSDLKVIDYDALAKKYSTMDYSDLMELIKDVGYKITNDEIALLDKFFLKPEKKGLRPPEILRDLNLAVFGYKERNTQVPKNKLYKVYLKNIEDYTEEQRLFLECYVFNKKDRNEFKHSYKGSSLYYRYYFLIDRLERTYYNIYRFLDNNFTKEDYIKLKELYSSKFSEERIKLLDLVYGVNGKALSISEISEVYGLD